MRRCGLSAVQGAGRAVAADLSGDFWIDHDRSRRRPNTIVLPGAAAVIGTSSWLMVTETLRDAALFIVAVCGLQPAFKPRAADVQDGIRNHDDCYCVCENDPKGDKSTASKSLLVAL
jgi:hypothetical protein